ncbi:hypothetical protein D3C71_1228750 [compost metagenome]
MLAQPRTAHDVAPQNVERCDLAHGFFAGIEGIVRDRIHGHAYGRDLLGLDHLPEWNLYRGDHHVSKVVIRAGIEPRAQPGVGHPCSPKAHDQGSAYQGKRTRAHVSISVSKKVELDEVVVPGPFQLFR